MKFRQEKCTSSQPFWQAISIAALTPGRRIRSTLKNTEVDINSNKAKLFVQGHYCQWRLASVGEMTSVNGEIRASRHADAASASRTIQGLSII